MPWKVDENGALIVENDNPVWIYEGGEKDGKEAPVEFPKLLSSITRLTAESMERKTKINDYKAKLAPIEEAGIEDVAEFVKNANTAIDTVQNLEDKKLVDAGEIDKLKENYRQSYDAKMEALKKSHLDEIAKRDEKISSQDTNIRNLVIKGAFESSEFLRESTVLLPDMAYTYFGDKFDVEVVDDQLTGFAKDKEGNKLMSLINPGEIASPMEAIEILVSEHPQKDRILKMDANGAGTPPGVKGGKPDPKAQYKNSLKNGDFVGAIAAIS